MPLSPPRVATIEDRASGRARYTADLIEPGMVIIGVARSPHAHARVTHIDISKALALPGVLGVLTPDDFKGIGIGIHIADEPVLTDHVRYVGEGIAAIAAVDEAALIAGIAALEIDYEILPHAITVDDALALDVPLHNDTPDNVACRFTADPGDWHAAVARVAHWVEGTFETAPVPHAYLEPRAAVVRVDGNHLELISGTHAPSMLAEFYNTVAGKWGATVDLTTPDMGGSFGAKWEHSTHLICLAFAHRLQQNVAMVLPRRDDMIAGRTRLAMRIKMRIGATAKGELVAKETQVWANNGAYSLHGPAVMLATAIRGDNLYKFSAIKAEGQLIYTNNIPSECFRGFGIPQSTFAQEQLIDELARKLGIEAIELRRRNAVRQGDTSIHGWKITSCGLEECLDMVRDRIQSHRDKSGLCSDDRFRIGYGVAANIHCVSNSGHDEATDISNIVISIDGDGMICVASGEVELGAGTAEVLQRTIERELDISRDQFRFVLGHTATGPFGRGSFASRTSFFMGHAAIAGARKFSEACSRLVEELGLSTNASIADIARLAARKGRADGLKISAQYMPSNVVAADRYGYGNIAVAYTFGVHGACVKIDTLTGKATIEQYWAAHDTGTVVNYQGAVGQVIGGVLQGIGMALSETTCVAENGELLNPGYLDDRVATFPDAPDVEVFFPQVFENNGPAGAKTVGEPPVIPVAGCVANAIYDAVAVRQYKLPMTPERVWTTLNSHETT